MSATEADRLKLLHDHVRYGLEDVAGHFRGEDHFERMFDEAIAEAEGN